MKLCTFTVAGAPRAGAVVDDTVVDLTAVAGRLDTRLPATLLGWVRRGRAAFGELAKLIVDATAVEVRPLADISLMSPLPDLPRSVICVAANYRDHVMEAVAAAAARGQTIDPEPYLKAEPSYFTKDPRSVCGPSDAIVVDPSYSTMVDWEVELAVVIGGTVSGDPATDVTPEAAMDHVFGYATFNDVSVRDIQRARVQMWKGKNLRGSSPFGPYIVTADDVDPRDLALRCWVNGELKQEGRTTAMIHGIPALVADLSRGFQLDPGDVIATGTTVGTGNAQNPPQFLASGDVLESEIEGLGRQRNKIVGPQR